MRVLPALFALMLTSASLAGCGSSNDGARDMDAGTSSIASGSSRLTLGVNSFLWHASLDTLSFLPLASADPFGGVIISEWYVAPTSPDERLKVTVYIMDRTLRADGLKVVVFRQLKNGNVWQDAQPSPDTAHKLEDSILTRARELRLASLGSS
ncbi:MAG TPA: DUF3576 domain-containing protein [Rhizomicrobium sp.]|jgi:hypothetical protein|nr:DUF3576 domain-containing protein [Rhizomicrobium sp.]